jgi:hypothetical protein
MVRHIDYASGAPPHPHVTVRAAPIDGCCGESVLEQQVETPLKDACCPLVSALLKDSGSWGGEGGGGGLCVPCKELFTPVRPSLDRNSNSIDDVEHNRNGM